MKKRIKNSNNVVLSIYGFILFLLTLMVTSSASIIVYDCAIKGTNGNLTIVIFAVLGIIIFGAILCTLADIVRRKYMIEKPVNEILKVTKKIASGDFTAKLEHIHSYDKFNEFDLIYDNINTMSAELSKNEILKNDFISNLSHEIKTPLAVIQNYAKALQNNKISNEKKNEYLNGLTIQIKKLSSLISNILKLNKLENEQIMPENKLVNVSELVRNCALSFENLIEEKNLSLDCDIDEICIMSSESLLEIALNNLISNAIKFTDNNGKIKIRLTETNQFAIIEVTDTGCGISNETGKYIFDKFYQGDTSHSSEGNGLGLSLVKKVIDILGGEITVESTLGKGSTFAVKLKK